MGLSIRNLHRRRTRQTFEQFSWVSFWNLPLIKYDTLPWDSIYILLSGQRAVSSTTSQNAFWDIWHLWMIPWEGRVNAWLPDSVLWGRQAWLSPFWFFPKMKWPDEVSREDLDPIVLDRLISPKHSKGGSVSPWVSEAANTRKGFNQVICPQGECCPTLGE